MDTATMTFLPAHNYFNELQHLIPKARKRIVIHAMVVLWGPHTEQLVPLLKSAAERGVEVRIIGDIFSKLHAFQPRLARPKLTTGWKHTLATNQSLQEHGIHVKYTSKFGINPYARRTHSKITLIDDHLFTFGGVNFSDDSFTYADYMLHTQNGKLAARLYDLVLAIEHDARPALDDVSLSFAPNATLLFDGGTPGKSPIYETACAVVKQAKKVYFVSQMCPSGELATLIKNTENECYFIRPRQTEFPANIALFIDQKRHSITNRYQGEGYIHAKFILTEGQDGSRHIISGSNNFSWRGISYGTKEIALHSTDPMLWQIFYEFMQREIVQPS